MLPLTLDQLCDDATVFSYSHFSSKCLLLAPASNLDKLSVPLSQTRVKCCFCSVCGALPGVNACLLKSPQEKAQSSDLYARVLSMFVWGKIKVP